MTLFFSLLPVYLFGNIHCFGMCGPLVMLIGRHRYRAFYFLGRVLSFSLAGFLAGETGAVLQLLLKQLHLAESLSLTFGVCFFLWGLALIADWKLPSLPQWKALTQFNQTLSLLLLKDTAWTTFLFGFFTIALPCGQSLMVLSACALVGDPWIGLFNGFALALLTSPALFIAMHAYHFFKKAKGYTHQILGFSAMLVGVLTICRGLAEMEFIPHLILNPESASHMHLVIF